MIWRTLYTWAFVFCTLIGCAPMQHQNTTAEVAQTPERLYALGMRASRTGDFVRATQYLDLARRSGYAHRKVMPTLLSVCIASGRYRAALAYAEEQLAARPEDKPLAALVDSLRAAMAIPSRGSFAAPEGHPRPIGLRPQPIEETKPHDTSGSLPPELDAPASPGGRSPERPFGERGDDQRAG